MTPVEKVARALAADRYGEDCADARWPEFARPARAAITALMEPSEEMVKAGFFAGRIKIAGGMCEDAKCRLGAVTPNTTPEVWAAMISKALE